VVLALAWAVFLIPKALKHHDEVARTRSIDRFSESTRVLARREPVNDRDSRLVVTPARPSAAARPSPRTAPPTTAPAPRARAAAPTGAPVLTRASARAAARRRRRLLGLLLVCVLATSAAAVLGYAPWWSVAVPGGFCVLFLLLCRTQVRRDRRRTAAAPASVGAARAVEEPATAPVETQAAVRAYVPAQRTADESMDANGVTELDGEDTSGISVADLRDAGLVGAGDGTLWDPVPVTLPTYVTAPKANRTVRTIDLGEPGTWTSGRTAEDAEIAVQAAHPDTPDDTGRHAVGS